MTVLKKAFIPLILGVMLALWFFVTLYDAKDGSLLASVLGTSFFEKVDPRYDVVVAFDQDNLVVAAHHAFEDVDEVKVLIAYDPDRLTIEFEPIVALGEVHMAVDHGMLTYIISDVYQINDEDDLLLLKTSGDKDAVVVSEVSVSFVGDTKSSLPLVIYNDVGCEEEECQHEVGGF